MYKVITFIQNKDYLPGDDGEVKWHLQNGDTLPKGFTKSDIDFFLEHGFIEEVTEEPNDINTDEEQPPNNDKQEELKLPAEEENKDEEVVIKETPKDETVVEEAEQSSEEKKKNTPKKTKGK